VREVDELEDPVDERVAERDEGVDRSLRQPDQDDVEEVGRPVFLVQNAQVLEEPEEDQAEEGEADEGVRRRAPPVSEDR
jgi:hypothetical protein